MTKLDLKGSVLLSIAYSGIFSFPLTFWEVYKRLLFFSDVSAQELAKALKTLVQLKQIEFYQDHFFIGKKDLVEERRRKLKISEQKIKEGERLVSLVRYLPWVKAMVVSGSIAVNNAKSKDDLDWLVITSDNSLWLVRPLLLILASFYGKRRDRNGDHRDNSWCFNMFLTESSLAMPVNKKSIYTAYEVCQARFLLAKGSVEKDFLVGNSWVEGFVPNFYQARLNEAGSFVTREVAKQKSLNLLSYINELSYKIQLWYMKPHITREKVALNLAFFHPRDTKKNIYIRWLKLINLPYVKSRN
ncbi:hypothetical protein KJZ63_01775 [Patescibacteria group bacterium]|nr:hypothetical protein [Patescibacteria group bacterium]